MTSPPTHIYTHSQGTDMILRISDQGGGIARDIAKDCLNWSFTTVEDVGDTGGAGMLGGVGANASGYRMCHTVFGIIF